MTGVIRRRSALLFSDWISGLARSQLHAIVEGQRPAHVGTRRAVVSEKCVDGAVLAPLDRKPLMRPALQSFGIHLVSGSSVQCDVRRPTELARCIRTVLARDQVAEPLQML